MPIKCFYCTKHDLLEADGGGKEKVLISRERPAGLTEVTWDEDGSPLTSRSNLQFSGEDSAREPDKVKPEARPPPMNPPRVRTLVIDFRISWKLLQTRDIVERTETQYKLFYRFQEAGLRRADTEKMKETHELERSVEYGSENRNPINM